MTSQPPTQRVGGNPSPPTAPGPTGSLAFSPRQISEPASALTPLVAHLARAVEQHRRWCRDNGVTVPPELFQLVNLISGSQARSSSPGGLEFSEDAGVPLAYDYDDAARLLGSSKPTVRRLVKAGLLRSIRVGSSPRIPRSEIERFINDQLQESA